MRPPARWTCVRDLLVRAAGFRFGVLEELAFGRTCGAIDRHLQLGAELVTLRNLVVERVRGDPAIDSRQRGKIWKRLRSNRRLDLDAGEWGEAVRDVACQWNLAIAQLSSQTATIEEVFGNELPERRASLLQLASDPRIQEAILLSSPQMLDRGVLGYIRSSRPDERPAKIRSLERQLVTYVQRFGAKNETTSFFGPITYGRFGLRPSSFGPDDVERLGERTVFTAYWVVRAIADMISAEPEIRAHLQPLVSPLVQLSAESTSTRVVARVAGRKENHS